ncbi:MAG: flippase [Nanoarchaeota archaeon]|nr:flippase [Nanoarchaeota archaeon]
MEQEREINTELKLLAKSSVIVFIGLLLSKIFTYVYRIIIARVYGPEIYGLFSLAIMVLGLFVAVFSLGLSEGLTRFIPWYRGKKQEKRIRYVFKISSIVTILSGIIAASILFLLSDAIATKIFHDANLIIFLKIFAFLIPIYMIANIFLSVLQSFEEITWNSFILNILQNVVKVFALVLFIFLGFETNAVIFSFFLGILSMLIVSYIVCIRITPIIFRKFILDEKEKVKIREDFFSYSWPLLFAGIISTLLFWIDSFSIGYFKTAVEVGLYNAAVPIILLIRFAPEIFLKLFFPMITRELSKGRKKVVNELSKQVSKWIFAINLPLFLLIIIFPEQIISILFGSEYLAAANSVRILSIGAFAISSVFISNNILYTLGKSKILLVNLMSLSILNIILNALLVPRYGINGAAFATTISNIILATLFFFQAKHYTSIIPFKKKMIRITLVSIIPVLVIIFLKTKIPGTILNFFLLGTFLVLSYGVLIFFTNCLDKNDFMILKSFKRKLVMS